MTLTLGWQASIFSQKDQTAIKQIQGQRMSKENDQQISSSIISIAMLDEKQLQYTINEKKSRKRELQLILHTFQKNFEQENGRPIKSGQDIEPMKKEYSEYKV